MSSIAALPATCGSMPVGADLREGRFQMLHRVGVARGRIRYELHVGGIDDCDATAALLLDAFDKDRAPVTDYDARRAGRVDNRARDQDPLDIAASRTLILAPATSDPRAILSSSSFKLYEASPTFPTGT